MSAPAEAAGTEESDEQEMSTVQFTKKFLQMMDHARKRHPEFGWTGRKDMLESGAVLLLQVLGDLPTPDYPDLRRLLKAHRAGKPRRELRGWRLPVKPD